MVEKKHDFSKDSNKSECIPLCFVGTIIEGSKQIEIEIPIEFSRFVGTIIEGSKQNSNREIFFHSHKPYTTKKSERFTTVGNFLPLPKKKLVGEVYD